MITLERKYHNKLSSAKKNSSIPNKLVERGRYVEKNKCKKRIYILNLLQVASCNSVFWNSVQISDQTTRKHELHSFDIWVIKVSYNHIYFTLW